MSNKHIAVMTLTNWGGVAINDINSERVIYQWYNFPECKAKIYYTAKGRPYFNICGRRFHLDQFVRC